MHSVKSHLGGEGVSLTMAYMSGRPVAVVDGVNGTDGAGLAGAAGVGGSMAAMTDVACCSRRVGALTPLTGPLAPATLAPATLTVVGGTATETPAALVTAGAVEVGGGVTVVGRGATRGSGSGTLPNLPRQKRLYNRNNVDTHQTHVKR